MADRDTRAKLARAATRLNARSAAAGRLPPLVLMTDDLRLPDPLAATRALPRGSLVILRARNDAQREETARALQPVVRERDHFLLIAGDAPLAARIGADGLHLPNLRAHEATHWRARCPRWLITVAAHGACALRMAERCGADAALLSPVFATKSHEGERALGAIRFRALVRATRIPVYALGGIDARTILELSESGAAGIAAIGALSL